MTDKTPTLYSVIEALDDIMNSTPTLEEMQIFSEILRKVSEVDRRIKQKFYENLSYFDSTKIRRNLDLIEYLTVHSPFQLAQLILDQKFIELFPYTLSEDDLKDPALNLLKLWTETYQGKRDEMALIFDFIDNLDMFDIHLPPVYICSYEKNVNIKRENNAYSSDSYPYTDTYPPRSGSSSKISSLINTMTELRDNTKQFLDRLKEAKFSGVEKMLQYANFMAQCSLITAELTAIPDSEAAGASEDVRKLGSLFAELKNYETLLSKKLFEPDAESTAPENDYKIIISDSENLASEDTAMGAMMSMQDFLAYKTHPCPKAIDCPYFDCSEFEDQAGYLRDQLERKCPYWHSENDRRRPVLTENKTTSYAPKMCRYPKNCALNDKCHFSHNFFESCFHPDKYKTDFCFDSASVCEGKKYCSSYHSDQERETWKQMLLKYEDTPESNENEDLNYNEDLAGWNKDDIDIESGQYPPPKKEEHKNLNGKANGVEEEMRKSVEMKGSLHSKLTIRKNYDSPSVYTNFFQMNGCFNGVPLFDLKGIPNKHHG